MLAQISTQTGPINGGHIQIDAPCPVDAWPTVVLRDASSDALQQPLEQFIERAKLQFGIEV